MRHQMPRRRQRASAFPTPELQVRGGGGAVVLGGGAVVLGGGRPHLVALVLEADVVGRHAAGDAGLHLALVEPALVGGLDVEVGGAAHLVVEVELLREAVVGLADGARFAETGEGGGGSQSRVPVQEIGDYAGC